MSYLQDNSKVEALTKAVLISILGVAIVLSNLLIIATYANFKGTLHEYHTHITLSTGTSRISRLGLASSIIFS